MQKQLIETNRLGTANVEYVYDENVEEKTHFVSSSELENFITEQSYCEPGQEWGFLLDQFDYVTEKYWKLWK